eukprot:TRINITY_DN20567_c0_g1_i1.p1 TRINITY_DN20567_c0_g1~~TRINITY_DN20567_c0_g1_i1.p1  ORF type:complete len:624 (+),score=94.79 TRINITY_DN20567_c0_g1_i1:67-1938(+)
MPRNSSHQWDERSFWLQDPSGRSCSLQSLLSHGLGYFWLSGLGLRSYLEPPSSYETTRHRPTETFAAEFAGYRRWCLEHLLGRLWLAQVQLPPDFSVAWIPPDYSPASGLDGIALEDWPQSMVLCAPEPCSDHAVEKLLVPFHMLVQAMMLQSRSSSVDVLRSMASQLVRHGGLKVLRRSLRRDLRRMRLQGLKAEVHDVKLPAEPFAARGLQSMPSCSSWEVVANDASHFCSSTERNASAEIALATAAFRACTAGGAGRYWAVEVRKRHNLSCPQDMDLLGSASTVEACHFCAPAACSEAIVRSRLALDTWALQKIATQISPGENSRWLERRVLPAVRRQVEVHVDEVAEWSLHNLSWAVLGFEGCGTTTLAAALQHHPALEVLQTDSLLEDGSYFCTQALQQASWEGVVPRLPSRMDVLRFNAWRSKTEHHEGRHYLRGVKRPQYIRSNLALARLAQIPGLRALLLVDEPAALAERQYLKNVGRCRMHNLSFKAPPLATCLGSPCMPRCSRAGDFRDRGQFLVEHSDFAMSERIQVLLEALGSAKRVFLADRGALRHGNRFYNRVAAFLGVASFPLRSDRYLEGLVLNEASGGAPDATSSLRTAILHGFRLRQQHEDGLAQ